MTIDVDSRRPIDFHPLPSITGSTWRGGPHLPDAALGWVQRTATDGHPRSDVKHAAIRRWTAPRGRAVEIKSTAIPESEAGDGARYWIFSGRHGTLKTATQHHAREPMIVDSIELKAGDTPDFVVDFREYLERLVLLR